MSQAATPERTEALAALTEVAAEAFGRGAGWKGLAEAGLLALPVPQEHGGEGLGPVETAEIARIAGRHASRLPVWETLCVAAPMLARHGSTAQRGRLLAGIAAGDLVVVPALREPGRALGEPGCVLADGTLSGRKVGVTHLASADAVLVSAREGDRTVTVLVDPGHPSVTRTSGFSSSGGEQHTLVFDGTPAEPVGEATGRELAEHAVVGLCSYVAGLLAGARDLTAGYIAEREQFGRRLAEFQAVAQQIAAVYVASRTVGLAAQNAARRVADGGPAADDLAVASYWTATQAPAALQTCHHLHGGMGVDETYPLPAYSALVTDAVHVLGGEATLAEVRIEDPATKNLELTAEQRALKERLREYFSGLVGPEDHREMMRDRHGATYRRTIKQMGSDGWMGVGWPEEYGGHGFGEVEQTIFANEAQRADVHLPAVTLQTVGPTLQAFGTPEQKQRFLGDILAGEVHFAIGYSEPDAGTDLASLRTSARLVDPGPDSDEEPYYLVNGQKIFTTGGHEADYIWLAARTDPDAPKHKGISILIVDTRDPGYSWTPIITCDGSHHVNATYYNDVKVPASMVVGEVNAGWRLITTQLNHERVMLAPAGRIEGLRDRVATWAERAGVADEPFVRQSLAEVTATFRINELLNWEVAATAGAEATPTGQRRMIADASASKVFASERIQRLGRLLLEVVARYGDPADAETGELLGYLDTQVKRNLVITFGGGVNEVQSELIAMFGLDLPRVPR